MESPSFRYAVRSSPVLCIPIPTHSLTGDADIDDEHDNDAPRHAFEQWLAAEDRAILRSAEYTSAVVQLTANLRGWAGDTGAEKQELRRLRRQYALYIGRERVDRSNVARLLPRASDDDRAECAAARPPSSSILVAPPAALELRYIRPPRKAAKENADSSLLPPLVLQTADVWPTLARLRAELESKRRRAQLDEAGACDRPELAHSSEAERLYLGALRQRLHGVTRDICERFLARPHRQPQPARCSQPQCQLAAHALEGVAVLVGAPSVESVIAMVLDNDGARDEHVRRLGADAVDAAAALVDERARYLAEQRRLLVALDKHLGASNAHPNDARRLLQQCRALLAETRGAWSGDGLEPSGVDGDNGTDSDSESTQLIDGPSGRPGGTPFPSRQPRFRGSAPPCL